MIDAMSDNDPTKWEYFEQLELNQFLQMCLYYKDKQEDLKYQRQLMKK